MRVSIRDVTLYLRNTSLMVERVLTLTSILHMVISLKLKNIFYQYYRRINISGQNNVV